MDDRTLKALRASIKHWEDNVEARSPHNASAAASKCALCEMFTLDPDDCCTGCPVSNATGQTECENTPYYTARTALVVWRKEPSNDELRAAWRKGAQAELDFLRSLLPKESV